MIIREFSEGDLARLQELHGGHDYEFPDPSHPLMLLKHCAVDEEGIVRGAALARLELHVTLMLDHQWKTPQSRLNMVGQLQTAMYAKASGFGLDEAFAEVPQRWGERLQELGWQAARNKLYYLRIN